tara:strand:- start:1632 stop:1949 length:318 start_codon:yes stop_codon:yes gene_type:complete
MATIYSFSETELISKLKILKKNILLNDTNNITDSKLLNIFLNPPVKTKKLVKKKQPTITLIPWRFHNISYFLNESTNEVYSFHTEEKIGIKKYDTNKELTFIDFD